MKKLLSIVEKSYLNPPFKLETDNTFCISLLPPFHRRRTIYRKFSFTIIKSTIVKIKYIDDDSFPNAILI